MTDRNEIQDAARDGAATAHPRSSHGSPGRRWAEMLMHRWPTALGIVIAGLAALDLDGGLELAALTVLMAVVYLGAAVVGQRWLAWVVLLAGLPLAFLIPPTSAIHPSVVVLAVGAVFLVVGVARGLLARSGDFTLQAIGMVIFGSAVLVALAVAPGPGSTLVGIAILGHGAWDAFHYVRDRVVPRTYAAFCAAVDVGVAILAAT